MADSAINVVDPAGRTHTGMVGDVPDRIRRRYLTDERNGPGLGFYVDATAAMAAFRDQGHRLSSNRNDPNVVRDLVAIAQHRGWSRLDVRGVTAFRREVWIVARAAGLEVRGYTPTERDLQDLARRAERGRATAERERQAAAEPKRSSLSPATRLKIVEAVVKDRIVEPAVQARILAAARGRLADWLERGARHREADAGRRQDKIR